MRLIHASSLLLSEFIGDQIPEYVILSHTWGSEELSLQDFQGGKGTDRTGFAKIKHCCTQALKDGFEWAWVDTCCIDKTNNAELSEAINSMYQWYRNSSICYAYLEDVPDTPDSSDISSAFARSRWFLRGWTLQELMAPPIVEFYNSNWVEIGTKSSLRNDISAITGISIVALWGDSMSSYSVAEKMSWASMRTTTRVEDKAYCLMGLFGINMPLLYGEGNAAFRRLQEEILKVEDDTTIFAWTALYDSPGYFAQSPADFGDFRGRPDLLPSKGNRGHLTNSTEDIPPPTITNRGLKVTLMMRRADRGSNRTCLAILYWVGTFSESDSAWEGGPASPDGLSAVCIYMEQHQFDKTSFVRVYPETVRVVPTNKHHTFRWTHLYLSKGLSQQSRLRATELGSVEFSITGTTISPDIEGVYPLDNWRLDTTPTLFAHQSGSSAAQAGAILVKGRSMGYFLIFFGMRDRAPWCRVERIPESVGLSEFGTNQVVVRIMSNGRIREDAGDRHTERGAIQVAAAIKRAPTSPDGRIRHRLHVTFEPSMP
ncbi:MAG: hypothetical protein M1840_008144 [Geoglossum simile]|nr:MAG: hypothetical protein M1840_008144 [Geoglossum simile]